jgi:hypothetical protein
MMSRPIGAADSVSLVDIAKSDSMPPPNLRTGELTHRVRANPEAQKWFNQGISRITEELVVPWESYGNLLFLRPHQLGAR